MDVGWAEEGSDLPSVGQGAAPLPFPRPSAPFPITLQWLQTSEILS